jgi:acyl-CoA synthetase (AMP-forming)/AMP-acid ligase II
MMIYNFLEKNKDLLQNAVICGEDKITYKDLYQKCRNLRNYLYKDPSAIIIIFIENSVHYIAAYFAILSCNKIAYPISSLSKPDELFSALERTNCKCILTIAANYAQLKVSCANRDINIITVDDLSINPDCMYGNEIKSSNDKTPKDTCLLLNTSGSTDKHKIVMLSAENIIINCNDWANMALDPTNHGNILVSMPASTSFGSIVITTCIMLGWTIVFMPDIFDIFTLLQTMVQEKITHLISIGTILNILALNISKLKQSNYHVDSLQFIGVGGNGAAAETVKILLEYFKGVGISSGYGITEATCMVSTIPPSVSRDNPTLFFTKINSAGKPFQHSNVRIFDADDYTRDPNILGEIAISGPIIMQGYYNNLAATQAAVKNGYLHTGDLGYFDEDGYLYVVGRVKNIIKSGGYSVFPEEIETVIINSKMASEAYVYGIPDAILDEIIIADVIPTNNKITILDIEKYCHEHLASYKLPNKIQFVTNIIKTSNGKIRRKFLQ